ncbi:MAG: DUF3108 domain-containing protein [Candidatus Kapaibacterium sp.]|jgi:hypothetical protein
MNTISAVRTTLRITICALLVFVGIGAHAQVLEAGEELTYAVSYLGVKLGTIRMTNEGKIDFNGKQVYKLKAYIDSRPGIPFVEIHTTFESWIDPSATSSYQFAANTKDGDGWTFDKYVFNYPSKIITTEKWMGNVKKSGNQYSITKKYNDGCSLFYCARQLLYSKNIANIPTIVAEDTNTTRINFIGKVESVDIDASSYPVRTVYFDGEANWTGVYGVTGYFQGWFSDDAARVPIKAKMKLYLGSANIELVGWKRKDWQPPKAQ